MYGVLPLACRLLMDLEHRNIWCILQSGISRARYLFEEANALLQTYYEENPVLDASDRKLKKQTRFRLDSSASFRACLQLHAERVSFHSQKVVCRHLFPCRANPGLQYYKEGMGAKRCDYILWQCWRICVQHLTMIFRRRRSFPTNIFLLLRSSNIFLCIHIRTVANTRIWRGKYQNDCGLFHKVSAHVGI